MPPCEPFSIKLVSEKLKKLDKIKIVEIDLESKKAWAYIFY